MRRSRTQAAAAAGVLDEGTDAGAVSAEHGRELIGAIDNGTGVVGMAPGARIWPVMVLNAAGVGFTSDIVCGIDYVTATRPRSRSRT